MGSQVLILTEDLFVEQSLGEWLDEMDGVSALFAGEREDGLYIARTSSPQWMIVDADLAKNGLTGFLNSLQAEAGEAKILLLYPKERKAELPWLDLSVTVSLAKPFTKAEFLRVLPSLSSVPRTDSRFHDRPTVPRKSSKPAPSADPYPWLTDQDQAGVALAQQIRSLPVRSALLFHRGELWASSSIQGDLSYKPALSELLNFCRRIGIMYKVSSGDLVRYVRLKSPDRLLLLFATRLSGEFNLALVLDAKTNFRDVRSVAKQFAAGLLQPPEQEPERGQDPNAETQIKMDAQVSLEASDEEELPVPKLSLGDVPEPTPASMRHAVPANPYVQPSWSGPGAAAHAEMDLEDEQPQVAFRSDPWEKAGGAPFTLARDRLAHILPETGREIQLAEMPGLPEAYEVVRSQAGQGQNFVMRVLSPAIYTLQYACLLLPRLPEHVLAGDLSVRLAYWLPRLMMAFGWRLERLAMQADYLHWIVSVPPEASAEYVLERTRIHTSEQIFQEFPRLKLENPSGDFWAPGYLVMTGTSPLPENIVRQYIAHTRHRQGFTGGWQ